MNSSDKTWRELFNKFNETYKLNRFRELGELKYSMRSVYKHMKFIKNWFLVVQGPSQIPSFIRYKKSEKGYEIISNNKTDIKLKILFHEDIFPNVSNLPNFCSDCIESSFAFIQEIRNVSCISMTTFL